jgi:hypothetical protein
MMKEILLIKLKVEKETKIIIASNKMMKIQKTKKKKNLKMMDNSRLLKLIMKICLMIFLLFNSHNSSRKIIIFKIINDYPLLKQLKKMKKIILLKNKEKNLLWLVKLLNNQFLKILN